MLGECWFRENQKRFSYLNGLFALNTASLVSQHTEMIPALKCQQYRLYLSRESELDNSRKLLPSFMVFVMWISACVCSRRWKGHSVPCSAGSWAPSSWEEMSLWAVCLFLNIKAKIHNNRNYCVTLIREQGSIMMHIKFRNILEALCVDAACALLVWLSGLLVHFICLAIENTLCILALCHRTWGLLLSCTQLFLAGGCREWW